MGLRPGGRAAGGGRASAPRPVALKDPKGYWIGTVLESTGIAYHPRLLRRLGVPPPKDWDDPLDPRLKGARIEAAADELKRRY